MDNDQYWFSYFRDAAYRCTADLDLPEAVEREINERIKIELTELARNSRKRVVQMVTVDTLATIKRIDNLYGVKPSDQLD